MIFVNNYACQRESHAGTSPSPTALALHRRVSAATSPLSTALAFHGLSPKSEWGIGEGGEVSFGYLTPLLLAVNVNILTKLMPVLNISSCSMKCIPAGTFVFVSLGYRYRYLYPCNNPERIQISRICSLASGGSQGGTLSISQNIN